MAIEKESRLELSELDLVELLQKAGMDMPSEGVEVQIGKAKDSEETGAKFKIVLTYTETI